MTQCKVLFTTLTLNENNDSQTEFAQFTVDTNQCVLFSIDSLYKPSLSPQSNFMLYRLHQLLHVLRLSNDFEDGLLASSHVLNNATHEK